MILTQSLPVFLQKKHFNLLMVGAEKEGLEALKLLVPSLRSSSVMIVAEEPAALPEGDLSAYAFVHFLRRKPIISDFDHADLVILASRNESLKKLVQEELKKRNLLVFTPMDPSEGNFYFGETITRDDLKLAISANVKTTGIKKQINELLDNPDEDRRWKNITTKLIIVFALMVIGHIIISYLPLPAFSEVLHSIKPYFNLQFLFFVLAGFCAQMVDGILSMGYGVTSATFLMSFGIAPVSVSAAIHTSEVFTTGVSGYSHYRFGNVNKKMFRHLVFPGTIGAILGALMLVFLGDKAGKWLLPAIAIYAGFLGVKILSKAFSPAVKTQKVKRIGWLAWIGGFLDSFGGGGWGPIVTSSLIAKGRSPKYTVGSVSLAEFFVTIASATTFFITVGVSHWNIVLGLLIGGGAAAPIAARLAGKLPKKTMMIAVGVIVIIWCIRMLFKSFM
jgi:uncharacterized membrane protein YfcA/siroheme synthase (precorrin-2 oxidase/ferrochelatase)